VPLLGLVVGLLFTVGAIGLGSRAVGPLTTGLPPSCRGGLHGLVGFGLVGLAIFLVGLASTSAAVAFGLVSLAVGHWWFWTSRFSLRFPRADAPWLAAITLLLLIRLPAALSPSDAADWDSISHQMAMAKIWLEHGRVDFIPFMHQSNIPATENMLYMLSLPLAGQAAAKSTALGMVVLAMLAVGGLAAYRYGGRAGWWAAIALLATPVVLSEVGTAYVDIAHGAYTGLAIVLAGLGLFAADRQVGRSHLMLAGFCLGFSLGTKYTGVQAAFAIAILALWPILSGAANWRVIAATLGIAAILACPWYIRNVVNTGNPVYPFFYSVFGGRNWNQENAEAYAEEQRSFGIGQQYAGDGTYRGKSLTALPGSVTALALQPDKQINLGTPWGAIGPLFLLGLIWWPLCGLGKNRRSEAWIVLGIAVCLVSWYFLTQQSRYIIGLMVPAAILLGGAVQATRWGRLAVAAISLQFAYTLFLFTSPLISPIREQIRFLTSGDTDAYIGPRLPFWEATQELNRQGRRQRLKVALYDEVRGFYLDVDYFWANPGHSRLIEYEKLRTPEELIAQLKRLGTTHVYMNFAFLGEQGWELRAAFFPEYFERPIRQDHVQEFRRLLVEAWMRGLLKLSGAYDKPSNGPPRAVLLGIE
jgi:hypothetical protein